MATSRTTYKYHFKLGNRIVHTGITKDLDRREAEHRRHEGWGARPHHTGRRPHHAGGGARVGARSAQSGQTNGTVTTTRSPRHRTRPAACRRAQGRRYCGVVDVAPRLVSPVRPDRTLRWQARPPRSLKTRTPRRLPVTRARARGGASPAAAALSARRPSSCPELNSTEQDVQHRCHSPNIFGNSLVVADFPGSGSFADSYREAPSQPAWGAANRTTAACSSSGMRPDPAEATKRIS